jgi:membrane protein DedA with SNARE-associated domain
VLDWLADLPPELIYLVIGLGAAVENVIPPIPADTFVLLGGFLTQSGRAQVPLVFLVTWVGNVLSAMAVYFLARRFGHGFFKTRAGHFLLQPKQLEQVRGFYQRWGTPAIFVSRFLPAFRAVVPVFAGVTHVPVWRVMVPLGAASALWYGTLIFLGVLAGRNWNAIVSFFSRFSTVLLVIAVVGLALVAVWWWRSRERS